MKIAILYLLFNECKFLRMVVFSEKEESYKLLSNKGLSMTALSELTCEACTEGTKLLTSKEIASLILEISEWEVILDSGMQKLKRQFPTKTYQKSISFTNAVATLADSLNHHPEIVLEYSSVTVLWWSHNIKGLHKNDFIMAAKTSNLF